MILPIIYAGLGIAFFTSLILITRRPLSLADKVVIAFLLFLSLPMIFKVFSHMLPPGSVVYLGFCLFLPFVFGPFLYL